MLDMFDGQERCRSGAGMRAAATSASAAERSVLPRFSAAGDCGLLVVLAEEIGEPARARVAALDNALVRQGLAGIVETVPAYTTLLVVYDPLVTNHDALKHQIAPLANMAVQCGTQSAKGRHWRIPVCYGASYGEDLARLAERLGLFPDDLVAAHSSATYTVHMLGFLPGFAYLAGLPEQLAAPRRSTPRQRVALGSVAIGGAQTAIWPIEGPCGWHLIGRTPCRTFERTPVPGSFLASGDRITFEPIESRFYAALERAAERGVRVAQEVA